MAALQVLGSVVETVTLECHRAVRLYFGPLVLLGRSLGAFLVRLNALAPGKRRVEPLITISDFGVAGLRLERRMSDGWLYSGRLYARGMAGEHVIASEMEGSRFLYSEGTSARISSVEAQVKE